MPNVGAAEILVILVVALLVFGPHKLPEIARQVGKAVRELRRMQASLRDEVREVLEPMSPTTSPPRLPPRTGEAEADDTEHPPPAIEEETSPEVVDGAPRSRATPEPGSNGRDAGNDNDNDNGSDRSDHGTPAG